MYTRYSLLDNFFSDTTYNDGIIYDKQENQLMVYVDVPGVKKEDLSIESIGNVIRINGKRKIKDKTSQTTKTFSINSKRYSLDSVEAALEDGVLQLIIKEKELEKTKQIPIKMLSG
ncbi:MAG TPA: Hsp20/alpha crystallin family protein [Candidatus Glassbacteria bacterium]|nr:Hsp20/alpha crystallin family protein [Candidatus Glassbacteria bacterium]